MKNKKLTEDFLERYIHDMVKIRSILWIYECFFEVKNNEEKILKQEILKNYNHIFSFSKEAYLGYVIFTLDKFFQKRKDVESYCFIKDQVENSYRECFTRKDLDCINNKYFELSKERKKLTIYKNHILNHYFEIKDDLNINIHEKEVKRLINFSIWFLGFLLSKIYDTEQDFGEFAIKNMVEREVEYMQNVLYKDLKR